MFQRFKIVKDTSNIHSKNTHVLNELTIYGNVFVLSQEVREIKDLLVLIPELEKLILMPLKVKNPLTSPTPQARHGSHDEVELNVVQDIFELLEKSASPRPDIRLSKPCALRGSQKRDQNRECQPRNENRMKQRL